ncbi:MAG: helix-turn-helix domain-containing protein [Phycicoccus sp.]|nr:helix-turn-helix domain-containing protein [Phycicoccus sp.]
MSNTSVTESVTTTPARLAYSPEEAANMIGMDLRSFYAYIQKGKIPSRRIGRRILVPVDFMDHLPGASAAQAGSSVQP